MCMHMGEEEGGVVGGSWWIMWWIKVGVGLLISLLRHTG